MGDPAHFLLRRELISTTMARNRLVKILTPASRASSGVSTLVHRGDGAFLDPNLDSQQALVFYVSYSSL
jgi:hypothetical protein